MVYVASLLILGVIFFFLASAGRINLPISIFLAALLAGIVTYLVYIFNFDPSELTEDEWNTLQSLTITALIVIGLSLVWVFFEAINMSKSMKEWYKKDAEKTAEAKSETKEEAECHSHVEAECGDDGCVVTSKSIHCETERGRAELDFDCNDEGCVASNMFLQKGDGTLNIKYIV